MRASQATASSEMTLMRARTSSLRLVSCVEVASIAWGQRCWRLALRAWNWAGLMPPRPVEGGQPVECQRQAANVAAEELGHDAALLLVSDRVKIQLQAGDAPVRGVQYRQIGVIDEQARHGDQVVIAGGAVHLPVGA